MNPKQLSEYYEEVTKELEKKGIAEAINWIPVPRSEVQNFHSLLSDTLFNEVLRHFNDGDSAEDSAVEIYNILVKKALYLTHQEPTLN